MHGCTHITEITHTDHFSGFGYVLYFHEKRLRFLSVLVIIYPSSVLANECKVKTLLLLNF